MPSITRIGAKKTAQQTASERALAALKETLGLHIEGDLADYDAMLVEMTEALEPLLKSGDSSESESESETVAALHEDNLELTARIAELEQALKKANAELKAAKKEKPTAKAKASKSKSTTKSGGERAANAYSSFMAMLKGMREAPEIADTEIKVDPQFSATAEKSKARYEEHREEILHDGQPMHGQTVTLQEAYDAITAAHEVDPMFKNAAVRTAILWAMIPVAERADLVALGREHGLCR
jgi:outer membrane murein-binding lipoprotein Lpp